MGELLADRIAVHARNTPGALAVVDRRESVTYGDFWTRVTGAAAGMRGMRRVAVLPTSDVGSLVTAAAAMLSGVAVVLLHRHLLPEQFARVLEISAPDVVVAEPRQHARLRRLGCADPVSVDSLATTGTHSTATAGSELLVGVTSGTTGEPKLFVRGQRSWAATLDRSDATFDIRPGDRVATPGVLDHTHFLYGALHGLTRGAAVDLRPAEQAVKDAPTHIYSVPTIAWDLARSGVRVPSVREVLSSAARWPSSGRAEVQRVLPNAALVHFYGASELSFVSFDRGVDPGAGTLFDGVDVEIRDGIVHVRSDMLFDGYLTDSGIAGGPAAGWMTVGDRGTLHGRELTLFGRDSETLIRAGLNVELAPIEAALVAIPAVTDAAAIAVPDARMGEAPAVAVVLGIDPPDTAEIWRHLRASLPSPSIPVQLVVLQALPRTPRGKLDRQALGAIFATVRTDPSTTNHSVSAPFS
ncbi:AMP-binding protein [Rhodococcoides yunnanense]|uniref:AMP-binding protein n=1 Tax=Rhodococcoides yunnanense TaxID=278209 RepID=UPI0009346624|nr:AMP-binding protein [Rhodococcus yunnanensis]